MCGQYGCTNLHIGPDVVMGEDSFSEDRGFESRHHLLDGHFVTYICCKICNDVCLKRPNNRDRCWPVKKLT